MPVRQWAWRAGNLGAYHVDETSLPQSLSEVGATACQNNPFRASRAHLNRLDQRRLWSAKQG